MENNLENKILDKIQEQDIKPVPKVYFVIKNILFWGFWIFSIIIGALAFSVMAHMLTNNDWDLYKYTSDNFLAFTLSTLPYLWIFLMIIFVGVAYLNFLNTKGAYKRKVKWIIVSSLIFSVLLGMGFASAQIGEKIDKVLSEKVPQYKMAKELKESEFWNKPAKGILSGEIKIIKNEDNFILECCCGYIWNINGINAKPFVDNGIKNVRVIGEKIGEREFRAYDMRPAVKYREIKDKMREIRKIIPMKPSSPPQFKEMNKDQKAMKEK